MEETDPPAQSGTDTGTAGAPDALDRLAASARGWHRIQLAVLSFVGLCGVLWANGDPAGPRWLQWLAGGLAVLALALACLAVFLVGRVAHPFQEPAVRTGGADPATVASGSRRLRTGIRVTYLAVVVLVVATLSAWWPSPTGSGEVEVRDAAGQLWCGELADAPTGAIRLDTADGPITVPLDRVAMLRPTSGC